MIHIKYDLADFDQSAVIFACIFRNNSIVRLAYQLGGGSLAVMTDDHYYAMRAQQELDLAALATDPIVKALHLNMAAEYATLREQSDAEIPNARNGSSN